MVSVRLRKDIATRLRYERGCVRDDIHGPSVYKPSGIAFRLRPRSCQSRLCALVAAAPPRMLMMPVFGSISQDDLVAWDASLEQTGNAIRSDERFEVLYGILMHGVKEFIGPSVMYVGYHCLFHDVNGTSFSLSNLVVFGLARSTVLVGSFLP